LAHTVPTRHCADVPFTFNSTSLQGQGYRVSVGRTLSPRHQSGGL